MICLQAERVRGDHLLQTNRTGKGPPSDIKRPERDAV